MQKTKRVPVFLQLAAFKSDLDFERAYLRYRMLDIDGFVGRIAAFYDGVTGPLRTQTNQLVASALQGVEIPEHPSHRASLG